MNAAALARLATSLALAEDRPLAEVLPHFTVPGSVAAAHARAGRLAPTLRTLGFSPSQVQLATLWPRALLEATRLGASLPSRAQLLWPLLQVALYLGLLGLLEAGVLAVLRLKVLPVLAQVARTTHVPGPELLETVSPLLGIILLGVLGYGAWGAAGVAKVPGWARHLARAREAAGAIALLQAGAPEVARAAWRAACPWLGRTAHLLRADDLRTAMDAEGALAELKMQAFVARFRLMGLLGLIAFATLVLLDVYRTLSWLGGAS